MIVSIAVLIVFIDNNGVKVSKPGCKCDWESDLESDAEFLVGLVKVKREI